MSDLQKIVVLCVVGLVLIGVFFYAITTNRDRGDDTAVPTDEALREAASTSSPSESEMEEGETATETAGTENAPEYDENLPPSDVGMEYPILEEPEDDPRAHVFEIEGRNYAFDISEIRVTEGDTVTIQFESADGFHDWTVDAFNVQSNRIRDGESTSVTFTADRAGTYEYYCSVGNHRAQGMVGELIVAPR